MTDGPYATHDITERLEAAAQDWVKRSALYGMSSALLLREAKEEIERLRNELKKEMMNTHFKDMRRRRK